MGDVIVLKMREREMKQTIRDQAELIRDHETIFMETKARLHKRIKELEDEQLGQQLADEKVKYFAEQVTKAEENDRISRAGWRASDERIMAAIAALEKHDCHPSCDGVPEKALALLRIPVQPKPVYTAIFLDEPSKDALLKAFPPIHPKVFGHHVTLAFKPGPELIKAFEPLLEKVVEFEVVGEASDDKGQAVKVTLPEPYNAPSLGQLHHVTISCVSSPVYSNELLKKGWGVVAPIRLKGTVRHFTK
jgi:hypothetical protein